MSKAIAIIPARGGSKRLLKKNILPLNKKPMIYWTIKAARDSGVFDKVLVSTDDKEIAKVAKSFNAEVPFLRTSAVDDHAEVSLATLVALKQAEEYWQCTFDKVTQLMPNCPLRTSEHIVHLTEMFQQYDCDSLLSCFPFGWMNPWWSFTLSDEGIAKSLFPDALKKRSQDLPELYSVSGAIWIAKADALKSHQSFYTEDRRFVPLSWKAALDIDTKEDLQMAEVIMSTNQDNTTSKDPDPTK